MGEKASSVGAAMPVGKVNFWEGRMVVEEVNFQVVWMMVEAENLKGVQKMVLVVVNDLVGLMMVV